MPQFQGTEQSVEFEGPANQQRSDSVVSPWAWTKNTELFWLTEAQWIRITEKLPKLGGYGEPGDWYVLSGVVHMLLSNCPWPRCPEDYGLSTTIHNRFVRWVKDGRMQKLVEALAGNEGDPDRLLIDISARTPQPLVKGGPPRKRMSGKRKKKVMAAVVGSRPTPRGARQGSDPVVLPRERTETAGLFRLSDAQWARVQLVLPPQGNRPVNERNIVSAIVHVLRSDCPWSQCPPAYGPRTTIYNRFMRWAKGGDLKRILAALAGREGDQDRLLIDPTVTQRL
jgi:transposase